MEHLNRLSAHDSQYMTSLEIAEVTGKLHKDVLKAIRNMATFLGLTVKLLNKLLVKEGVQYYNGGRYKLTADYEGSGLAQERSFHYFGLDGEKKERKYLVWTRLGVEFVKKLSIGH